MQCRGQIDGAVAMGFGWALTEKMVYDDDGRMVNPQLAQLPHPGLRRRAAHRGVLRRHLRSASARSAPSRRANARINPVAPAIANARRQRHRRALCRPAVDARPHLRRGCAAAVNERCRASSAASHSSRRPACATEWPKNSSHGRARSARRRQRFPGFIEQSVLPPKPAAAGRLGDPAALRQCRRRRDAGCVPRERHERVDADAPMLAGRDDVHLVRDGGRRRHAGAGVRGDLDARQAGPGSRLPRLGAAHRRRPGQGPGLPGLSVRAANPRRAG